MIVPLIAGETTINSSGAAVGRHLLHHQRQLVHARAAAAVLLGQVDADEAEFACLVPQFVGVLAGAGLLQVVVLAVVGGHRGDGLAQRLLLLGLDEAGLCHRGSPCCVSTRASTAPTSTCWPASTLSSASTPSLGAVTVCSIFIASSQISGWPAVTVSPDRRADAQHRARHGREQRALRDRGGRDPGSAAARRVAPGRAASRRRRGRRSGPRRTGAPRRRPPARPGPGARVTSATSSWPGRSTPVRVNR